MGRVNGRAGHVEEGSGHLPPSPAEVHILHADTLDPQSVVVDFSDNTTSVFTVQQLLGLTPERLPTDAAEFDA